MRKVMIASAADEKTTVVYGGGHKAVLAGVTKQCKVCHQAEIVTGGSIIVEILDGYHLEVVADPESAE